MEKELIDLLGKLDLKHLSQVFVDNQVTMRDLQKLQSSDLQDIGIKRLMDRKQILEAAKQQQPEVTRIERDVKSVVKTAQKVILSMR